MQPMIERLVSGLEALTRDAARLRHRDAERLIELAAVATAHAVALETLREERADAIWRDAHMRPPHVAEAEAEPELPERLAA
jgi:hypothetical protein